MNPQGFYIPQKNQRMVFPPQFNPQLMQKSFTQLNGFNLFSEDKVKYQNQNQYQNKNYQVRKTAPDQASPQYDLFQIEKKRKKQKYKRSTNNSHKKFISALRRLFYAVISTKQKEEFETKYSKYRSCRTFFFIILAYMKYRFSSKLLNSVRVSFINEMKIKIKEYQEQIIRTKNMNLKNFRQEEIIDIKYSIKSCNEYFQGNTRQAIQCMYKKDKSTVIKRQHYESALRSVHMIEKELNDNPMTPLEQPYVEEFSHSSDRQKIERKVIKREIRESQIAKLAEEKEEHFDFRNPLDQYEDPANFFTKKGNKVTADSQNEYTPEDSEKQVLAQKQILYPPLLEAVPYIKYDPFCPPFRYKRQTKYRVDIRQDFFGYMNYGFPKFYERGFQFQAMGQYFPISQELRRRQ